MESEAMPSAVKTDPKESISALAGRPASKEMLVDLAQLEREYFDRRPDLNDPNQNGAVPVSFRMAAGLD
jgi:hypothetical protein